MKAPSPTRPPPDTSCILSYYCISMRCMYVVCTWFYIYRHLWVFYNVLYAFLLRNTMSLYNVSIMYSLYTAYLVSCLCRVSCMYHSICIMCHACIFCRMLDMLSNITEEYSDVLSEGLSSHSKHSFHKGWGGGGDNLAHNQHILMWSLTANVKVM